MRITEEMLREIAPYLSSKNKYKVSQDKIIKGLASSINELMDQFEVNTVPRQVDFLAQICHEAAGFMTTQEFASGRAYEGRKDLGNNQAGDGARFKGRGLIQTTGRYNYTKFTTWCRSKFPDCPDFVQRPSELERFPWAILAAFYYWDSHNLNRFCDANDFRGLTKAINGGYNGLTDRQKYRARASAVLGGGSKSSPSGSPSTALLALGSRGTDVLELQTRLKQLNYRIGTVDGDFGAMTASAVRDFQADQMLKVDGLVRVGGDTWKALGEALETGAVKTVSEKRQNTIGSELKESRIVSSADQGSGATILGGGAGGLLMFWDQGQDWISTIASPDNIILGISVVLNIFLLSRLFKSRSARVEDHQKGKTV